MIVFFFEILVNTTVCVFVELSGFHYHKPDILLILSIIFTPYGGKGL